MIGARRRPLAGVPDDVEAAVDERGRAEAPAGGRLQEVADLVEALLHFRLLRLQRLDFLLQRFGVLPALRRRLAAGEEHEDKRGENQATAASEHR